MSGTGDRQLGKYQLQREIGRGGMGTVYLAYDPLLDRQVAIKVLAPHLVWEQGFVERFLREARSAARLKHPNIVTIFDVGQDAGAYFFVMEYLPGQTLAELIKQHGALPAGQVMAILQPLAAALDYAHAQGLIHRDVKPGNILLGGGGQVTLTDFGIARAVEETRLTTTGTLVGTPEYMSPEQARGEPVSFRTDQYSLAVVAYEMLGGRTPFGGTTPHGVLYKQVYEQPPPISQLQPGLPPGVGAVLGCAMAKEPAARYASVTEFVAALGQVLAGQPLAAAPAAAPTPPPGLPPTVTSGRPAATDRAVAPPGSLPTVLSDKAAGPAQVAVAPPPAARKPARAHGRTSAWLWLAVLLLVAAGAAVGLIVSGVLDREAIPATAAPSQVAVVQPTRTPSAATRAPAPTRTPTPSGASLPDRYECTDPIGCVVVGPGQPVRVGYLLVMSGPDASLGIDSRRGVEIAVEQKRDVLGHPIELVGADSLCTAEGGRAGAQKLAADGQIVAVVGTSCSAEARAAIPLLCQAGIPLVSPSNTAVDLTGAKRPAEFGCYLRTIHSDAAQGLAAARFAREMVKSDKAATIYDPSPYSTGLQEVFARAFRELGGTVTAQEPIDAQGQEAPVVLERLVKAGKPDLIFFPVFIESGAAVARTVRERPALNDTRLLGADGLFSPDFLAAAGPAAQGVLFTSPDFSRFDARYREFRQRYLSTYGVEPVSAFHAHAYDAATLILDAVQRSAVQTGDGTLYIPRRGLLEALYATRGFPGLTGQLSCSRDGDCASANIAVYETINIEPLAWNPGAEAGSNPSRIWP